MSIESQSDEMADAICQYRQEAQLLLARLGWYSQMPMEVALCRIGLLYIRQLGLEIEFPKRQVSLLELDSEPRRQAIYTKKPIPPDLRWEVWERDNYTCLTCGARRHLSVDHVYPESLGGAMSIENLQTLCRECNRKKGATI